MSHTLKRLSKKILRLIDRMPIGVLFLIVCLSLLLFAALYRLAAYYGQGPVGANGAASFANCVYFSIVTFTTLGYGDIVPKGASRVLACLEVMLGIAFFGVFISKLSSAKQSYHLAQLYARDAQERLDDFAIVLKGHGDLCKETLEMLKRGDTLPRSLSKIQLEVYRTVMRIRAYVSFEISNGDFLLETPIGAPARLMKRSAQLVSKVAALGCFPVSLHSQKQRVVAERIIQELADIGNLVKDNCEDPALTSEASNLLDKCAAAKREVDSAYKRVAANFRK
jgi:uncharacterized membrane protein YccC